MAISNKPKSSLLVFALLGASLFTQVHAAGPFYTAVSGDSIRWSNLKDYGEYLGPAGSTNPAYTVGYKVYDYYGNAPQPDGTFNYEYYQTMDSQVADSVVLAAKYNLSNSVSVTQNPFNPNIIHRIVFANYSDIGYVSLNTTVLGNDLFIHQELTQGYRKLGRKPRESGWQ